MKSLRIVFMGTPDFAVGILDAILEEGHNLIGIVTAPDRPAGRGRKVNESAVKKYATRHALPVLQPTNLNSEDFLDGLREWNADLQIVVAFRMLPKVVWQMPVYGTFNLHASLLPEYRGAAPINWAIMNGETKTGVTTFFIDDKIDTGAIILQKEMEILATDDAGSLHDKLMYLGAEVVLETIGGIALGKKDTTLQKNPPNLKLAHKIHRDTCEIDWKMPIEDIYNFIRGLSPYPAAWTHLYNGTDQILTKIYRTSKELAAHQLPYGSLIADKKVLKVAVKGGYLKILELQLQGKRKMPVADVLNGLQLAENAHLG